MRGSKSAKGVPYPLADLDRGGGSRSAVTPARIPYRSSLGGKMEWLTASKALLKSRNIDTA